jgi:hypothetical protein
VSETVKRAMCVLLCEWLSEDSIQRACGGVQYPHHHTLCTLLAILSDDGVTARVTHVAAV